MVIDDFIASYVVSSGDGDRCALYELIAAIATRRPEMNPDEVFVACRDACTTLVGDEHVHLEMTPPHADRPGRDGYTAVAIRDAAAVLHDRDSWQSPSEALPRYWLVATESGKAAFISQEIVSL